MATVELDRNRLAALLREAADAHHVYEEVLGHADDAWAEWYADYVMDELGVPEEPDATEDLDVLGV